MALSQVTAYTRSNIELISGTLRSWTKELFSEPYTQPYTPKSHLNIANISTDNIADKTINRETK